ncbi:zinc finger protein 581-like [Mauremys reevesii]|uniref:zinc finger protein 581-like n=1 Tax=Mauremys reevesii TaxID=260615 RepID=UPI00193F32CE|nr:zinc finger protein 581-like [Mauremys reevesii]
MLTTVKSEVLLRAHLQAHVTPGQFECPSCGYAFRHKHHLQRHQARMHGIPSSRAKKRDVPPVAQLRRTQQGDLGTEPSACPLRRAESRMRASKIQDPPAMLAAVLA